jgi:hypothetical protein
MRHFRYRPRAPFPFIRHGDVLTWCALEVPPAATARELRKVTCDNCRRAYAALRGRRRPTSPDRHG